MPWASAHDKLTTAIAGGNTPDMSVIGTTWMAEMAGMNGFQATPTSIKSSDFYPGQWDTTKYKDTSYGVPFIADTRRSTTAATSRRRPASRAPRQVTGPVT